MNTEAGALGTFDVLRIGLLLLAFVIALYTLFARERKLPYLINSIFYITYSLFVVLLAIMAMDLLDQWGIRLREESSQIISALAVVAFAILYWRIFLLHNRILNLRHDQAIRNTKIVRFLKHTHRRLRARRTYEHRSAKISQDLLDSLCKSRFLEPQSIRSAVDRNRGGEGSLSTVYNLESHNASDDVLTDLAARFIRHDCWVQYTTCSRHPVEFLRALGNVCRKEEIDWEKATGFLVLVDAYTPHFGFTDSIHGVKTDEARKDCLQYILTRPSFAGIHTAGAAAFNVIKQAVTKKTSGSGFRGPTLVIYEGLHALVDLESSEQYRIFYNHVLPSERLWGSMFTVVVEFMISEENLRHIKVFADYFYTSDPAFPNNPENDY